MDPILILLWLVGMSAIVLASVLMVRSRRSRASVPPRPTKGTRPQVKLSHDGLTYDLTDDLQRVADDETGRAVWVVHGPLHVRMPDGPMLMIDEPTPEQTQLRLMVRTSPASGVRFATPEEITEELSREQQRAE